MKHKYQKRSACPINFALETFGDPWSLLIIRDMIYFGKHTYGEFLDSEEGIATNILASRLAHLEQQGILEKKRSELEKRKEIYTLTEKGLDLIPVLAEMANWSAMHDPCTGAPPAWIECMNSDREKMIQLIRKTVQSGGSVFVGPGSVLQQVGLAWND
jgi:DNA-binding HxlR family transcriptional regulator